MVYFNEEKGCYYFAGKIYKDGKIVKNYRRKGFPSRRKTQKAEREYLVSFDNEYEELADQKPSFEYLYKLFEPHWKTQVKPTTVAGEHATYKKLFEDLKDVDIYDPKELQKYINRCDKQYSKNYVEKLYYAMSRVFTFAVNEEIIESHPLKKVYRSVRKGERKKEFEIFEPQDFAHFMEVIEDPRDRAMFSCLYWMGLRKGEMMALKWKDIDLKNKKMKIDKTLISNTKDTIGTPKRERSYRTISMPKVFMDELLNWNKICKDFSDYKSMYVFGSERPIAQETLRRKKNTYIKIANEKGYKLPQIRIHDFRHSHASYLINNMGKSGFSDFDIAKRLGDSVEMLHKVYAHWFTAGDENIMDFIDNIN